MKKVYLIIIMFLLSNLYLQAKKPYCKNMKSCKEACDYYNKGYLKLDRDHDGIPCENVCSTPCKQKKKDQNKKKKK